MRARFTRAEPWKKAGRLIDESFFNILYSPKVQIQSDRFKDQAVL
jgi:hypothetical protein